MLESRLQAIRHLHGIGKIAEDAERAFRDDPGHQAESMLRLKRRRSKK
jgi:hypothetical protein